jgi:hypothetical protein
MLEELITTTDSSSSSSIDESSSHESSSVFSITTEEIVETTSISVDTSDAPNPEAQTISSIKKIDDATGEKLIALPISTTEAEKLSSTSESVVVKQTTPKTLVEAHNNKSTAEMRNDINAYHQSEDASHEEEEGSHEQRQHSEHHYDENNFSNADNFQPYKPNRHRSIAKQDHHHGAGFAIGKILG